MDDNEIILDPVADPELGVEVETPTPEVEVAEPVAETVEKPAAEAAKPESELEKYSKRAQKRIAELTYHRHEAERQREEALNFARAVQAQNETLRKSVTAGHQILATTAKEKAESQLASAKQQLKQAYDLGDGEAIANAAAIIAKIENEHSRVQQFAAAPPQIPQLTVPVTEDVKAKSWAKSNPWFGSNEPMTGYAMGYHQKLVSSGIDPNSEKYYEAIDSEMRKRFPEQFSSQSGAGEVEIEKPTPAPRRISSPVAPSSRNSMARGGKVTLSASQVAVAEKLKPSYIERDAWLKMYASQLQGSISE